MVITSMLKLYLEYQNVTSGVGVCLKNELFTIGSQLR